MRVTGLEIFILEDVKKMISKGVSLTLQWNYNTFFCVFEIWTGNQVTGESLRIEEGCLMNTRFINEPEYVL